MYKSATKFSLRRVRILLSWDPKSTDNCIESSWPSQSWIRLKIDSLCRGWNTAAEPENLNVQDRGNLILDPSLLNRFPFRCYHIHCHCFKLSQIGPPLLITIFISSVFSFRRRLNSVVCPHVCLGFLEGLNKRLSLFSQISTRSFDSTKL